MPLRIIGDVELVGGRGVEGWCWSPDRPSRRLSVQVLLDGRVAAATIADVFRPDLLHAGRGDGFHAFRIDDLDAVASASLLTARDAETRRVFGQRRLRALQKPASGALNRLEDEVAVLRSMLGATREPEPERALRDSFAVLAHRLRDREAPALPPSPNVRFTWFVWVEDAVAADTLLAARSPTHSDDGPELVLADAGTDPLTELLYRSTPGARFLSAGRFASFSRAIADACSTARGRTMLILHAKTSAGIVITPFRAHQVGDTKLTAGGTLTAARRWFPRRFTHAAASLEGGRAPDQLVLAIAPALLIELGGFDPALDASPVLAALDVCLKAEVVGEPVLWAAAARTDQVDIAPDLAVLFAERWGLSLTGAG
ncbi:MAG: hypothetical protein JOY70_08650 [Acidisphaera sp.]|nr:hypothetical protein [Acidisphaera sp.]